MGLGFKHFNCVMSDPHNKRKPQIINGITHWRCGPCDSMKPETEFYRYKGAWNGLRPTCKKCHNRIAMETRDPMRARKMRRESMNRQKLANPEKFKLRERLRPKPSDPIKNAARQKLNSAVKSGKLVRPASCSVCGASGGRIDGHHHDYTKPLDVVWLCTLCHGRTRWKQNPVFGSRKST
jgi:hypothetical protein